MRIIPKPNSSLSTGAHASTHLSGGSDPILADNLSSAYIPSNYTSSPTGSILGHLAGIDIALANAVGDKKVGVSVTDLLPSFLSNKLIAAPGTPIGFSIVTNGGNEQIAIAIESDKLSLNFIPSAYATDVTTPTANLSNQLAAHLAGINNALLGALTLPITAPPPTGLGIVVYNPVGGGVTDTGIKFFGNNNIDPTIAVGASGDLYYNPVIGSQMQFDSLSNTWLSIETATFAFGRNGPVAPGQYYRGVDGAVMSPTVGWYAASNGTVVSITYTRSASSPVSFEVYASGVLIGGFTSSASKGVAILNIQFNVGDIISVKNSTTGVTRDVQGWVKVKWRA